MRSLARRGGWLLATALLLAFRPGDIRGQESTRREYEIKAAFLFNFSQFVTWAPTEFPDAESPFVIGVLGEDPFGPTLDAIVAGETVYDRPVIVRRYSDAADVDHCQILFVSRSEGPRLAAVLARLAGRGTLTVGDTERFAQRSGMIGFLVIDNRLQLEINADAVAAAGLEVSSKLLGLARIVGDRESGVRP